MSDDTWHKYKTYLVFLGDGKVLVTWETWRHRQAGPIPDKDLIAWAFQKGREFERGGGNDG